MNKPNSKVFIKYSNTMGDVWINVNDYNTKRSRKILIVFDDIIADINTNKEIQVIVKDLLFKDCSKIKKNLKNFEILKNYGMRDLFL